MYHIAFSQEFACKNGLQMVCIGILYVNALGNRWHHGFLWQMWIYSTHNTLKSFACSWKATKMKWKFRFVNQLASAFATVAVDNIQFSLYCKIWVLLFAFYLQLGVSACSMCICLFEYTYAAFKLFDWHHVMIRKLRSQLSFNPNFLIFFIWNWMHVIPTFCAFIGCTG